MKQEQRPAQKPEHKKANHNERKPEGRVYKYIAFVSFKDSKKIYTFGTDVDEYRVGDDVVVETIRGLELGKIVKETETFLSNGMEIKPITRKATERDLKQAQENIEKAGKAMEICAECIRKLGLDMNLIRWIAVKSSLYMLRMSVWISLSFSRSWQVFLNAALSFVRSVPVTNQKSLVVWEPAVWKLAVPDL